MSDESDSSIPDSSRFPFVLGDPNSDENPFEPNEKCAVSAQSDHGQDDTAESRRRGYWQSLGVPQQTATTFEPISLEDSRLTEDWDQPLTESDESDSALESSSWGQTLLRPSVIAVLLLLVGLVSLFVLSQVLLLINQLSQLPGWVRPLGYGVAAVLCGLTVYAMVRVGACYFSLRATVRISLRSLGALRQRARLRSAAIKRIREARKSLAELLEHYPLSAKTEIQQLKRLGMTSEEVSRLAQCRRRLLVESGGSSEGWMENFNRQFLQLLDEVAERRIALYAKRTGFSTGAAHRRSIDTLIVAMNAYLMVGDLCRIYNVRAGGWGTARILAYVFFNTFAASRVDDLSDAAADHAANVMSQHAEHVEPVAGAVGVAVGGAVGHVPGAVIGAKVASKVASRIVSGGVNAILLNRLGKTTIRQLRPLQERPAAG
jgi:uncharacterized membrane protein YcjF (UPF0283 family)